MKNIPIDLLIATVLLNEMNKKMEEDDVALEARTQLPEVLPSCILHDNEIGEVIAENGPNHYMVAKGIEDLVLKKSRVLELRWRALQLIGEFAMIEKETGSDIPDRIMGPILRLQKELNGLLPHEQEKFQDVQKDECTCPGCTLNRILTDLINKKEANNGQ